MWKIVVRVVPWLIVLNFFDAITRSNVANAKDQQLPALHMQNSDYSIMVSLFYASYIVFQIPATAILGHLPTSKKFGVACILLGFVGCLPAFVHNFWQFCIARILLGLVQAGNFPGICICLAQWFSENDRASAMSYVGIASSISQISSGAVAYGILQVKHFLGLRGWQWMFIIEGFPAVFGGILMLLFMPDSADTATWLTPEEKVKVKAIAEFNASKRDQHESFYIKFFKILQVFKNWKLWVLGVGFLLNASAFTFYMYYAPSIISSLGIPDYKSNLITVPLQIANTITGIVYTKLCQRYGRGKWQLCTIIAALGSAASLAYLGTALHFQWNSSIWISLVLLNMLQGIWFNPGYTWATLEAAEVPSLNTLNLAFMMALSNVGAMLGPQVNSLAEMIGSSAGYGLSLFMAAALMIAGTMLFITLTMLREQRYKEIRAQEKRKGIIPTPISVNLSDETTQLLV